MVEIIRAFKRLMPPPTLFSWYHLLWLGIVIYACVLICIFRKKIDKKAVREDLISDPSGFSSGSIRAPRSYWNSEEYRKLQES